MPTPDLPPLPPQPALETPRLVLRPFAADDAATLVRELSDPAVARQTLNVPHPYPPVRAAEFLADIPTRFAAGRGIVWAVALRETAVLVGAVGLDLVRAHRRAELGYWIAKRHWGQGLATEAAQTVVHYGFGVLGLHRIEANYFPENPASGAVMRKLGMHHEGRLRAVVWRDGVPRDLERFALLATDPRA
jgi:ribosomal-protein-alanine N-acetyltransferase